MYWCGVLVWAQTNNETTCEMICVITYQMLLHIWYLHKEVIKMYSIFHGLDLICTCAWLPWRADPWIYNINLAWGRFQVDVIRGVDPVADLGSGYPALWYPYYDDKLSTQPSSYELGDGFNIWWDLTKQTMRYMFKIVRLFSNFLLGSTVGPMHMSNFTSIQ